MDEHDCVSVKRRIWDDEEEVRDKRAACMCDGEK